jgi:uncharacterized SAM-dependent methyltransferase
LRAHSGLSLKIGCVDLSTALLYKATSEFQELGPQCEIVAGHFDIENTAHLSSFREAHFEGFPVVVLFIGNTLGNVDEQQMLREFGSALRPKDLLIIEVLLHDINQAGTDAAVRRVLRGERRRSTHAPLFL